MKTAYAVVATLNNCDYTRRLLESFRQVETVGMRVVVIDNGSTDDTLSYISSLGPAVVLIANERNLGAAGAWNQGARIALANGADGILICGNDTLPQPGCIDRLWRSIEDGALFVTGTQVPYDLPEQPTGYADDGEAFFAAPDYSFMMFAARATQILGTFDLTLDIRRIQEAEKQGIQNVRLLCDPHDYGLFDSAYWPAYFEDQDHHYRCRMAGIPCVRDPGAFFRHECSLTIRTNGELGRYNQEQSFRANHARFASKWGSPPENLDIQQARPNNISEAEWAARHGNRTVVQVSPDQMREQARGVYARYGIAVS